MKSTKEVNQKLLDVNRELEWINTLYKSGNTENDPYMLRNGKRSNTGWTLDQALTHYTSERRTLEWVLGKK